MELLMDLLVSILATGITYMAFPVGRILFNRGRFEKKRARKIALWNSIIVGGIYFLVTTALGDGAWNPAPAFLYYWINRAILTERDKKSDSK